MKRYIPNLRDDEVEKDEDEVSELFLGNQALSRRHEGSMYQAGDDRASRRDVPHLIQSVRNEESNGSLINTRPPRAGRP